eukprot:1004623-Alexandrium_andersonii.AAC.1
MHRACDARVRNLSAIRVFFLMCSSPIPMNFVAKQQIQMRACPRASLRLPRHARAWVRVRLLVVKRGLQGGAENSVTG